MRGRVLWTKRKRRNAQPSFITYAEENSFLVDIKNRENLRTQFDFKDEMGKRKIARSRCKNSEAGKSSKKKGGMLGRKTADKRSRSQTYDIVHEEGRELVQHWRDKRLRAHSRRSIYHEFLESSFNLDTFKSFFSNINLMVIVHMVIATVSVYVFQTFDVTFDIHASIFVSPIVFPLAFSINTDFQRREKVLEDLAVFKSSGMIWFFCMREWKQDAGLGTDWMTAVRGKLKSLLFHLHEYLKTYKLERRKIILRILYEDFSDASQLIDIIRTSKLPANTAIVSRAVHLLNMMILSFERLRVIREYRSPRSIRSFNKVIILFLPVIMAPYFINLGSKGDKDNNTWQVYFIVVLVAFVFSTLQGVQDKLDDPFDGMGEDDINLETIDEWTAGSLDHTMKRTFNLKKTDSTLNPQSSFRQELNNIITGSMCSLQIDPHLKVEPKDEKTGSINFEKHTSMPDVMNGGPQVNTRNSKCPDISIEILPA